ncbi:putative dehydrogenase [Frankia torreyi]|uniref:Putative dehydrogenase n=1 Tax=Frankia torreyi TaxID=1856 RepID=A0A0D8BC33_9ACTN|nr:putative dehydrogenase [Frankia torreyi]KQM03817.1 putative dehydrogenase [Frankia sp. CpI1-P]
MTARVGKTTRVPGVPRIHLVSNLPGVNALGDHLRAAGLGPTSARSADALLVLIDRPLDHVEQELLDRARQSVPVLLAGPTVRALPADSPLVEASGLIPGRATPPYELRLQAGPQGGAIMARSGDFRPRESWVIPEKVADDVERLVLIRHEMGDYPVCTWRPATGLGMFTLGTGAAVLGDAAYHRLVGRWLRHCLGVHDAPPVGVGLLGTPDTTAAHHAGLDATEGLELTALCDGGPGRAPAHAAGRLPRRVEDPDDLVNDPELGVVVVATPTHTHLEWAGRALEAGKHVVVQAPLCLATSDADQLAELAAERSLLLAVYPEGRADPGYRALRAAVGRGAIGEPLRLEVHRGGLRRPVGTWRDDERISGGQLYDRGAAGVDQVLALVDEPVEWVSAAELKRVWYHVSNADHSRLLLRFASGAEAQITVSDLTVAARPSLEVLGSVGTLILDDAPAAANLEPPDGGPAVTGRHAGRRAAQDDDAAGAASLLLATYDGVRTRYPLPAPGSARVGTEVFYRDLADSLVSGWPLAGYEVEAARPVVAVLEAAVRSVATGGAQVVPL